jgi:hypothetical protein
MYKLDLLFILISLRRRNVVFSFLYCYLFVYCGVRHSSFILAFNVLSTFDILHQWDTIDGPQSSF